MPRRSCAVVRDRHYWLLGAMRSPRSAPMQCADAATFTMSAKQRCGKSCLLAAAEVGGREARR